MRLKSYPIYKNSGVPWLGEVPGHWEVRRLRNVAEMRVSNVDKHTKDDEVPVRLCNYTDVYKHDRISDQMPFMRATASPEEMARFRLERGDVLITKDSEAWNDIGVPALVEQPADDLICGYHLALLRPLRDRLEGEYLFRALQSNAVAYQFHIEANGVTRYGLSHAAIKSIWLPLPSLPEQAAIVCFLDHVDRRIHRYIRTKQKLIKLLEEQKQAIIHRAVTRGLDLNVRLKSSGVKWLGEVPEHWGEVKVKRAFRTCSGGTPNTSLQDLYYGGDIPWIRTMDLTNGLMDTYEIGIKEQALKDTACKIVPPGTVLIAMYGGAGTIGKNGLLTFSATLNQAVCGLLPSPRFVPEFVLRFMQLQRPFWMVGADGTRKDPNISQERIRDCLIIEPPLQVQRAIVAQIAAESAELDRAIRIAQSEVALLREYRTRLIADVVTGKLDVREAAASLPQEIPETPEDTESPEMDEEDIADSELGAEITEAAAE